MVAAPSSSVASTPVFVNNHLMVRRGKDGIFKPKAYLTKGLGDQVPKDVHEALVHTLIGRKLLKKKFLALINQGIWSLIDLPIHRTPIGCQSVFKVKKNVDGNVAHYKARLVTKGYCQTPGQDFKEI